MTKDETPTPGPELDSVYQPGTPGAPWTKGEVMMMMMMPMMMLMMLVVNNSLVMLMMMTRWQQQGCECCR